MSDHDSIAVESRWSELYRALLAPGTTAWALAPTAVANQPVKERGGDAAQLIAEAEHAGAGRAVWAVVAPLRLDVLVIDLDRCARQVWPALRDVLDEHSAQIAHLAASGSPDSIHVGLKCSTPEGTHAICDFLGALRTRLALSRERVDIQPPGHLLRLPGSASLKPGGRPCIPVSEDLKPITAVAAATRANEALGDTLPPITGEFTRHDDEWRVRVPAEAYEAGREVIVRRRDGRVKRLRLGDITRHTGDQLIAEFIEDSPTAEDSPTSEVTGSWTHPPPALRLVTDNEDPSEQLQWQAPRAWRHRQPLSAEQWKVLNDTTTTDRSAAATTAAWVLWNAGLRSFAAVRWYYRHLAAFNKFRDRDANRKTHRTERSACAAHWQYIADRARSYRPPIDPADQAMLNDALSAIATWDDPTLVAAGRAIITHRFADGHGLTNRPISKRCLAGWLYVCDSRAYKHLAALVDLGLLTVSVAWEDGPPSQATLYSLGSLAGIYRGDRAHDVTNHTTLPPPHPLWGQAGYTTAAVWEFLRASGKPCTSAATASGCGLAVGGTGWGVHRLLTRLGELGLVTRTGSGRGTRWLVTPAQASQQALDQAATHSGAFDRARQLLARIIGERQVWHAEGPGERARMKHGLSALQRRLTHSDIAGRGQGSLFTACAHGEAVPFRRARRPLIRKERGAGIHYWTNGT